MTYAGGGGGGVTLSGTPGTGGTGGGGNAGTSGGGAGSNGSTNLGGGGGGASTNNTTAYNGGSGGSGVVIVKWPNSAADPTIGAGLTYDPIANDGNFRYVRFTQGTGTINW